jgi:large subunit ribosomal protein LP1
MSKHNDQLACIYAGLLLQDSGIAITEKNIQSILAASHYKAEPYWAGIFAGFLKTQDIAAIIKGGAQGSSAPAVESKSGKTEEKKVEKKEEKKVEKKPEPEPEEDGDMGMSLFGGDD